jgi:DinB family protein
MNGFNREANGGAVASIDAVLAASRTATEQFLAHAEAMSAEWATPRARGKWSPSQIVEHVARSYDGAVHMATGAPSAFPRLPGLIHPFVRIVFRRLLRKGSFPNSRTTRAMNPVAGPSTPAEGRARLAAAHDRFEAACRDLAARGAPMRTTMFGAVAVEDFVRFLELHTRHHDRQISVR